MFLYLNILALLKSAARGIMTATAKLYNNLAALLVIGVAKQANRITTNRDEAIVIYNKVADKVIAKASIVALAAKATAAEMEAAAVIKAHDKINKLNTLG